MVLLLRQKIRYSFNCYLRKEKAIAIVIVVIIDLV